MCCLFLFIVGNVPETPNQPEPVGSRMGLHTAGKNPLSLHINLIFDTSRYNFTTVSFCLSDACKQPGQVSSPFTDIKAMDKNLTHRLRGHRHNPESVMHRVSNCCMT